MQRQRDKTVASIEYRNEMYRGPGWMDLEEKKSTGNCVSNITIPLSFCPKKNYCSYLTALWPMPYSVQCCSVPADMCVFRPYYSTYL